jgi:hypothetical protein
MCKGGHCLVTLQAYTYDLGVGIQGCMKAVFTTGKRYLSPSQSEKI